MSYEVVWATYVNCIVTSVESEWYTKYVEVGLGLIYDCYSAEVAEAFGAVWLLVSNV